MAGDTRRRGRRRTNDGGAIGTGAWGQHAREKGIGLPDRQSLFMRPYAAAQQFDDPEQEHCAEERDEQRREAEVFLVDGAHAHHRGDEQAAQVCADDADDDVQERALLGIRAHHLAGEPADNAAEKKPENEVDHVDRDGWRAIFFREWRMVARVFLLILRWFLLYGGQELEIKRASYSI